jgi:type IV pilus assembly protein PilA
MKDTILKKFLLQKLITLKLCDRYFPENKPTSIQGFTLIELMVVIVILGILASLAIPTFLNQTFKAKQTEAKIYVSAINTAQKDYFTEKTTLAPNLAALALDILPNTENYNYTVSTAPQSAIADAASVKPRLKAYVGQVYMYIEVSSVNEINVTALSVICEARNPTIGSITAPSNAICDAASSVKVDSK